MRHSTGRPSRINFVLTSVAAMALVAPAAVEIAGASEAWAADLPSAAAPAPILAQAAPSWAGLYAGTAVGWGFASFRSSQGAARTASKGSFGSSAAFFGWQLESKPFVYGVEGELGVNSLHVVDPGVVPGLAGHVVDPIDTVRLRARLGYDLGDFLPFVAAGAAFSETDVYGTIPNSFGQKRGQTGLSLGAGLEWRVRLPILGPSVLRGEYIWDSYPTASFNINNGGPVQVRGSAQYVRVAIISHPGEAWKASAGEDGAKVDWSGDYAGVLGGGAWSNPRTSFGGATTTTAASGPALGVFSGKNFAFGSLVLGFEGATMLENVRGSGAQPGVGLVNYRDYLDTDIRGRAGWAFGRVLPYLTAGLDWTRSQQSDPATGSSRNHVLASNAAIGGGLEYMLSERWSTRAEYIYETSYRKANTGLDGLALAQAHRAQTVRLGLAYYFH